MDKEQILEKSVQELTNDLLNKPAAISAWRMSLGDGINHRIEAKDVKKAFSLAKNSMIDDPYIANKRVKNILTKAFSNTERDKLEQAILDPENHEELIRSESKSLYYSSYPIYREKRIYSDILSYHNYSTPVYGDFEKEGTDEDLLLMESWNQIFSPKYTFRRIASQVQLEGKVAYYYRQAKSISKKLIGKAARYEQNEYKDIKKIKLAFLQQLPSDYWKITGFSDINYYTISFNFMYFFELGASPEFFDAWFVDKYNQIFETLTPKEVEKINKRSRKKRTKIIVGDREYDITDRTHRVDGMSLEADKEIYSFWVQLPPESAFVFSEQETTPIVAPSDMGLFLQAKDLEGYAMLQQQISTIPLNSMLVGEIPYFNNNLSGNVLDDFRIQPDAMMYYNELFNLSAPVGVGIAALPYENIKHFKFDGLNGSDIYSKAINQFVTNSTTGGLFTVTDKPNQTQTATAATIAVAYADFLYRQFENFVRIVYDKHLGLNNKWDFHMFGDKFSDETTYGILKGALALGQTYLLPKFMSMQDQSVMGAENTMKLVENKGLYDLFRPLASSYTSTGTDERGGRPLSAGGSVAENKQTEIKRTTETVSQQGTDEGGMNE